MDWSLLIGLGEEERRQVLAAARRRRFGRREVLFHHGDPADSVHLIASGSIAVYVTTPLGNTAMFDILTPGDAVGEMALVDPGERSATAIALEPSETHAIHRDQFERLRERHPEVDRLLVTLLAARVRRLNAELVDAYFTLAEKRVLRRVLALAERLPDRDGARVIRLTQEDLAGLAGTSRATVNRTLRELEEGGAVSLHRGSVEVLDLGAVASAAR